MAGGVNDSPTYTLPTTTFFQAHGCSSTSNHAIQTEKEVSQPQGNVFYWLFSAYVYLDKSLKYFMPNFTVGWLPCSGAVTKDHWPEKKHLTAMNTKKVWQRFFWEYFTPRKNYSQNVSWKLKLVKELDLQSQLALIENISFSHFFDWGSEQLWKRWLEGKK